MIKVTKFVLMVCAMALLGGLTGCVPGSYKEGLRHYRPDDPKWALREVKPLAERGSSQAQFDLGSLYYQGRGIEQDYREALRWFRKAAEQGHVYAQVNLGSIYAAGVKGIIEQDYPQALMWFVFAASAGDEEALKLRDDLAVKMTPAQIAEAQKMVREFKPPDVYAKLLKDLTVRAEKGDPDAQFQLALMYYHGKGIAQDYGQAVKWFRKAGLQGNIYAQHNVGYMYEKGEGAPQDYVEAAQWYHLAAERGNTRAQYVLGYMYEKGQGVPQDEVQALMWFSLASARGDSRARMAMERVKLWMSPEQVIQAQQLAREFNVVGKKD